MIVSQGNCIIFLLFTLLYEYIVAKNTGYSESDLTDCVNKHSAKPALNQ